MKIISIITLILLNLLSVSAQYEKYTYSNSNCENIFDCIENYNMPIVPDSIRKPFDDIAQKYGISNKYTFTYLIEFYIDKEGSIINPIIKNDYDNKISKKEIEVYDIFRIVLKNCVKQWKINISKLSNKDHSFEKFYITYKYHYDCLNYNGVYMDDGYPYFMPIGISCSIDDFYEAGPPPQKKTKNKSGRNSK